MGKTVAACRRTRRSDSLGALNQFIAAKESYERVLQENPAHAKVLQQLGGLYHRSQAPFYDPEASVQILTKSLESGEFPPCMFRSSVCSTDSSFAQIRTIPSRGTCSAGRT